MFGQNRSLPATVLSAARASILKSRTVGGGLTVAPGNSGEPPVRPLPTPKEDEPSADRDRSNLGAVLSARRFGRFERTTVPDVAFVLHEPRALAFAPRYYGAEFSDARGKTMALGGHLRDLNAFPGGAPAYGRRHISAGVPARLSVFRRMLARPGFDLKTPPRV